jgi:hypothetical protein
MLDGAKRDNSTTYKRLPITANILEKLVFALQFVCKNKYEQALFTSVYIICYFGLMRVSEVTVDSKQPHLIDQRKTLLFADLIKLTSSECEIRLKITKTTQKGPPTILNLSAIPNCTLCPVAALQSYTKIRPASNGSLFIHFDASPLTIYHFSVMLKKALRHAKIPNSHLYKNHSFRIGCSSQAASNAVFDEEITQIGRWSSKSRAYKRYIGIPCNKLIAKQSN